MATVYANTADLQGAGFITAVTYNGLGVLGSNVPGPGAGPHGAGYIFSDLGPGDASKEYRGRITVFPSGAVSFRAFEDTSFLMEVAADGSYPFTYELIENNVSLGTQVEPFTVGAGAAGMGTSGLPAAEQAGTGAHDVAAAGAQMLLAAGQAGSGAHVESAFGAGAQDLFGPTQGAEATQSDSEPAGGGLTAYQAAQLERIEKLLRNRRETDPVTGLQTIYDDDGVTPLWQGAVWENVAGTIPYRGNGIDRQDYLADA